MKYGALDEASVKEALLLLGLVESVHEKVKVSLLASVLPLPFKVTLLEVNTFCACPAFAVGATFTLLNVVWKWLTAETKLTGAVLVDPELEIRFVTTAFVLKVVGVTLKSTVLVAAVCAVD